MENIIIEARGHLPYIEFNSCGMLKLEGRSIPEDVNRLFDPLIDFVSLLKVPEATLDINLDYFNTATSKKLLEIMKELEQNNLIEELRVNWHYETGDEDSLEMAEIYEDCLQRTKFNYYEYEEAA
jgi:hypothetical protein